MIQQGIAWNNKFLKQFEGMDAEFETLARCFSYGLAARDEEVEDLQDYKNSHTEGQEIIGNLKAELVQLRKYVGKLELKLREAIPIADSIDPDPYPQPTHVFEFVNSAGALLKMGSEHGSLSDEAAYAIIHGLRPEMAVRQELYDHGWIEDPDTAVMVWTEKGMWPLKGGEQ